MAIKLTKRKGFNFFRSYYDVYNELETDADKVAFIDALLDRQFLGIKPTNLKGMAKFAYISQTNSIDSQVKGYEDKTKTILDPTQGGCVGVALPPTEQVEEEVEVKEKVKDIIEPINWPVLLDFFNKTTGKKCKVVPKKAKEQFNARLKEGFTKVDIANAIVNASNDDYHIKEKLKYITLEFISRADKLDKFSQIKNFIDSGTTNQKLMKYDDSGQIL
jgi:uncharacterized phage protein (TIGR02220 family)